MPYLHNIENCFASVIGDYGLLHADFDNLLNKAEALADEMRQNKPPLISITQTSDNLAEIQKIADNIRNNFDNLIVIGTGGSTLCAQALTALKHCPHLYFAGNPDPHSMTTLLKNIEIRKSYS